MYQYRTEILELNNNWKSDKANMGDAAMLDELLNLRSAEGWELCCYDYMKSGGAIRGAFIVTFRKKV